MRAKREMPASLVSSILAALFCALAPGCGDPGKVEIVAGLDVCRECQMVIDSPRQAAGYLKDGEFLTFDSPICLLRSYESLAKRADGLPVSIYFSVSDEGEMQPAEDTTFLLTQHRPTVMDSGAFAFADAAAAETLRNPGDETTDWPGFRLARGKPDRVVEVRFGPDGMVPEVVNAARGELVEWNARSSGLASDLVVSVKGYPELEPILLPASGETVVFRIQAERPGAGFPIVATGTDAPLGRLKVTGPHTVDEEEL